MSENRSQQARTSLAAWQAHKHTDYLQADANIQRVLQMYMGEDYSRHRPVLSKAASISVSKMDSLAINSNRDENLPRLNRFNNIGERTEEVVFHPDYHELGACVWDTGVLAVLEQPGNELLSGALAYFIAHNGEAGHACPVACTAGLIKLLQQVGSTEQKKSYLPQLLETDYATRLHGAQFVTEVQGGSDVAAISCVAVVDAKHKGLYRISGEKWFCSVIDAGLFVLAARPEGAPQGTQGLALFLVPRTVDDEVNGFSIRRLKYKLGTRSMASAEVDFNGALAEPIGPLDKGFKNLVGIVLDTSRVHNAVAACGLMRRACIEAQAYARHRTAFGKAIIEHATVAQILARMKVISSAAVSTTFRILAMNDRLTTGKLSDSEKDARRTHVNINKYWTAIQCTQVVRDAIEVLGGNGTIEEFSVLPRLYRDAIVLESWEGTHNTLCAQVLRDFATRGLHLPWLAELSDALSGIRHVSLEAHRSRATRLLDDVTARIERLLASEADYASLHIRGVVDRMCVFNNYLGLLLELEWELGQNIKSQKSLVIDLYYYLFVDQVDPMDNPELPGLIQKMSAAG
ncbi:MAG: acyl-CoA dehydrogenase family protein [Gammaproteobacteria bacterium]|nr:MAG: acyl-CoA dehydrogenase family protein [Gammaproteobacteria bacterium]